MTPGTQPSRIRFGAFEADLSAGELRKGGLKIKLQPQPFEILTRLLERAGKPVTREEIQTALWSDDTSVEFDLALNTAIKKLRVALRDDAKHPRYIETLPRKGYRFVFPVEYIHESAPVSTDPSERKEDEQDIAPPTESKSRQTYWRLAAAAAALVIGGASLAGLVRGPMGRALLESGERSQELLFSERFGESVISTGDSTPLSVPLTSLGGHERQPELSPDGEKVAFVWDGGNRNNHDIYVKPIGGDALVQLTDDPATECCPVWSPDGGRVAFLRSRGAGADLIVIPAEGGAEQTITRLSHLGEKICWSSGSRFIAAEDRPEDEPPGIFFIFPETGESRRMTSAPPGDTDRWPALSPDGRTLAFARGNSLFAAHTLELGANGVPVGEPKRVTSEQYPFGGLDWTPDGRVLVFGIYTEEMGWRLWSIAAVAVAGRPTPLEMLGTQPSFARAPLGSAVRLAYVTMSDDMNIYRIPGPGAASTPGQAPERIAGSSRSDSGPTLNAQGDRIVFVSGQSGYGEIWTMRSDGSEPRQITDSRRVQVGTPSWSPDGRQIGFNGLTDGSFDVYLVDAAGGVPRPLTEAPSTEGGPIWSRDGRWVYFMSNRTGRPEIWKKRTGGGDAIQVTFAGGYQAREAPDGRWLYYVKSIRRPGQPETLGPEGEPGVFRMPLAGGPEERILTEGAFGRWALSRTGVYLLSNGNSQRAPSIDFFPYETWQRNTVMTFPRGSQFGMANSLTVSLEDRWIVYAKYDHAASDLMLLEDYQ